MITIIHFTVGRKVGSNLLTSNPKQSRIVFTHTGKGTVTIQILYCHELSFRCIFSISDYAARESLEDLRAAKQLPDIPTQPMGYEDAQKFLMQLSQVEGSEEVKADWRGGISGITYKYGGSLKNNR